MAEQLSEKPVELALPGGRRVVVTARPDGSIRLEVDGGPYVLGGAVLGADSEQGTAVLTLSPGRQGSNVAYNYVAEREKRQQ